MVFLLPARQTVKFILNLSFYDSRKINEQQIAAYTRPLSDPGNRNALLETARQCIPADADELVTRYKEISVPTLILWGRHDKVIPLKVGELLSQALPNSVFEVFEECGHIPQEEQPQKTIASISRFLNK